MILPAYNLSPFDEILSNCQDSDLWKERFRRFFTEYEHTDSLAMDYYYDTLLYNREDIFRYVNAPILFSSQTGLFSFDLPECINRHTFGIAAWFRKHHTDFRNKRIGTIVGDYGILNLQLAFSGLKFIGSVMNDELGGILTCIGNEGFPYTVGGWSQNDVDVVIAANVFYEPNITAKYLPYILRAKRDGKEVYIVSETYYNIYRFQEQLNPNSMEYIELDSDMYSSEEYSNLRMGWGNKIYRMK